MSILGLFGSYGTAIANSLYSVIASPSGFLTPILGQVLGTAGGGSVQTVSQSVLSSLSSF